MVRHRGHVCLHLSYGETTSSPAQGVTLGQADRVILGVGAKLQLVLQLHHRNIPLCPDNQDKRSIIFQILAFSPRFVLFSTLALGKTASGLLVCTYGISYAGSICNHKRWYRISLNSLKWVLDILCAFERSGKIRKVFLLPVIALHFVRWMYFYSEDASPVCREVVTEWAMRCYVRYVVCSW